MDIETLITVALGQGVHITLHVVTCHGAKTSFTSTL